MEQLDLTLEVVYRLNVWWFEWCNLGCLDPDGSRHRASLGPHFGVRGVRVTGTTPAVGNYPVIPASQRSAGKLRAGAGAEYVAALSRTRKGKQTLSMVVGLFAYR